MKKLCALAALAALCFAFTVAGITEAKQKRSTQLIPGPEETAKELIAQGREIFRFDTFGDEAFWGGQLHLHRAVNNLSPRSALSLGLKVDSQALSRSVIEAVEHGRVNLDDPAVTRALIKQNAVLGVKGFFNDDGTLKSIGLTCAVCHSTVDNSIAPGIGKRIDGVANHDLNVGAIIAAAPSLQPVVNLLRLAPADASITADQVRAV